MVLGHHLKLIKTRLLNESSQVQVHMINQNDRIQQEPQPMDLEQMQEENQTLMELQDLQLTKYLLRLLMFQSI